MPTERVFLDWNVPLTQQVRQLLLPPKPSEPVDLGSELIIVPTHQAGRRLREALAKHCARYDTALLPPHVETPGDFLKRPRNNESTVNKTEAAAIWADILRHVNLGELSGLYPTGKPHQDFNWALHTGKLIQKLRDTLADNGYHIANVYRDFKELLEEPERWQDLTRLESVYLDHIHQLDKRDPIELMVEVSQNPELPRQIKRIVLAAVPDPTPLLLEALRNLSDRIPVTVLIHAPESLADAFDDWGRPITDYWNETIIDIPDPDTNILLAGTPANQIAKALQLIASEADRFGPADIAIGVPDNTVTPFLCAELESRGLLPFDPSGKPMSRHPLYVLLECFRNLLTSGSYQAFATFLRHADVLACLGQSPRKLLEELDCFQNEYLPSGWEDISQHLSGHDTTTRFTNLKEATAFTEELIDDFQNADFDGALRGLLQKIYKVRTLDPNATADVVFINAAERIESTLSEFEIGTPSITQLDKAQALTLLLNRLSEQRYSLEHEQTLIDLEGWLELPWNDAPLLIVTGMNEGSVPDSRLGDVFLPDSLRTQLRLRNDADRLAADIYQTAQLIASRRDDGSVCFIAGKTSSAGEPLKPSRLLFRCADNQLPHRVRQLFGDPIEHLQNYPPTISFRLNPAISTAKTPPLQKLTVTQLRDYLTCPFRFYLKYILGMAPLDDRKTEMDAMDFGIMVHHALHRMALSSQMRRCENERELGDFLSVAASRWVIDRFGTTPPLQVEIQLDAAQQRLRAAARLQANLIGQGWETLESEHKAEIAIGRMRVSGRIDRIDRHRETGRIRILDYKTAEKALTPTATHLATVSPNTPDHARAFLGDKQRRWTDLQLPLYRLMLAEAFDQPTELGYFNLPKATTETGLSIWEDFNTTLLASAKACAERLIEDVQNRKFWPPAAKVSYDDFEALFPTTVEDCVQFNWQAQAFQD